MSDAEPSNILESLNERLSQVSSLLNQEKLKAEVAELEQRAVQPEFWVDQEEAQRVTLTLARKKLILDRLSELTSGLDDARVLLQLASQENDEAALGEVGHELATLNGLLADIETETLLSGEYDARSAVMNIRSGVGGDDATDFAEMLMRMYLRYAEAEGIKATVLDVSHAEGAGIKSCAIRLEGTYVFGKLSVESGTHRLVRMSPFNAAGKRQTSFAAVEVVPLIESEGEISVPSNEIRVDVFRSSGPGGQSVNTTDSAVRVTHLPTGIVVSCQNEKSQLQNKVEALRVLQSKLLEMRRQETEAKRRQLAGDVKASWGEQIRSYVLAPYQMVKDLRTEYEENNPDDVFAGKLSGFIASGIRWRVQQNI